MERGVIEERISESVKGRHSPGNEEASRSMDLLSFMLEKILPRSALPSSSSDLFMEVFMVVYHLFCCCCFHRELHPPRDREKSSERLVDFRSLESLGREMISNMTRNLSRDKSGKYRE